MSATDDLANRLTHQWIAQLRTAGQRLETRPSWSSSGRVTRSTGLVIEATGLRLAVGAACRVELPSHESGWAQAQVVGFNGQTLYLMAQTDMTGLPPGARVMPAEPDQFSPVRAPTPVFGSMPSPQTTLSGHSLPDFGSSQLPVGTALLGRVVDGQGNPLDAGGSLASAHHASLTAPPVNPLLRKPIDQVLDVGVRAINGLLTVGRGQRMGLFAGSGVGKSVLLGMMARYTQADVIVVALIGERGREVQEFIRHNLGPQGMQRSVVVAAPADVSPLLRLQGAVYATRLAEAFRDEGRHVLLIMDSLTRYAMAQREIALAVGEPPATKGYPPSVFAKIPALVERAGNAISGNGRSCGSITAFYTVLTEGDDQQDPIADSARAILDGHIVLSRNLAESGHYPAIDIEASISRVLSSIAAPEQIKLIHQFKRMFSQYQRNRDLISIGAYTPGNDPQVDLAIDKYPFMEAYLQQGINEQIRFESAVTDLRTLMQHPINRNAPNRTGHA